MTTLSVHLRAPAGVALRGKAEVWLEPAGAPARDRKGDRWPLRQTDRPAIFAGRVAAGRYRLRGTLPASLARQGWVVPRVEVRVRGARQRVLAWLGQRGWPVFPLGEGFVPFDPPADLLAVVFEFAPPPPARRRTLLDHLRKLGFDEPAAPRQEQTRAPLSRTGSVMLLEGKASLERAAQFEEVARGMFPESFPRVGIPTRPPAAGLVIIDRRYVARFSPESAGDARLELLDEHGARHLRTIESNGGADRERRYLYDLFEFPSGELHDHLEKLESLRRRDEVLYAEPDLILGLRAAGGFPDDPAFAGASLEPKLAGQFTLALQGLPDAWPPLGAAKRSGSGLVTIAILDEGFTPPNGSAMPHEDAPAGQIAAFYDFHQGPATVLAPGEIRVADHGDRIWGILGAHAHNAKHITGIAPRCTFVLAERPALASSHYCEALLWLGGLCDSVGEPGFAGGRFSASNPWPADVVCCAHALVHGVPAPSAFSTAAEELATQGSSGNGCVLVYAAGNSGKPLDGWNALAEHARTVAVGNCTFSPYSERIDRQGDSNYGDALDLCALGDQAMTLHGTAQSGLWNLTSTGGGTSAASATVAGAVALLLADRPGSSLDDVRAALRAGALDIAAFNAAPKKLPLSASAPPAATPPARTPDFGSGLLNVERSLAALRGVLPAASAAPVSGGTASVPHPSASTQGGSSMALGSPTQVRLAAGIYGDYVHESNLVTPPGPPGPNWGFDPKPQFSTAGHQAWVQALFSGNANQVQKALDDIGVAKADQPQVKATLSAIDNNVALTVYKLLQTHCASHAGGGGAVGHTY